MKWQKISSEIGKCIVKREVVGGKKEVEGMAVSIVEFLIMNSSIMAKLEMANKFHLKWESALVKCGGRNGSINCGASKNKFFYYGKT